MTLCPRGVRIGTELCGSSSFISPASGLQSWVPNCSSQRYKAKLQLMQFNSTGMWRSADPFTGFSETSAFNKFKRLHVPKVCRLQSYCYCSHKSHDDDDYDDNNKFWQYLNNISAKDDIKELQKIAGMTLYYYMCRSWQDCCRRGENRSWPSASVESVDSECWCLNNANFYGFIMRLTVEGRIFILESYLKTMSYIHCRQSFLKNLENKRQ